MNLSPVFKYQLREYRSTFIGYTLIMLLLEVFCKLIEMNSSGKIGSFTGFELSSAIVGFIFGCDAFRENFHMMIQNNISRKTIFLSRVLVTLTSAVVLAVINQFGLSVARLLLTSESQYLLELIYPNYLPSVSPIVQLLVMALFNIALVLTVTLTGYLCGAVFYQLSKSLRMILGVGIPVFLFVIWPVIDLMLANGRVTKLIMEFITVILGVKTGNPLIGIAVFVLFSIVFGGISYLTLLKSQLKHS